MIVQHRGTIAGRTLRKQVGDSATRLLWFDVYGSRAAHPVVEQLERDVVADCKSVERDAVTQIAAMEKNLATIREPDETVALADEQHDDSTNARCAASVRRPAGSHVTSGRRLLNGASRVVTHGLTSAVPTGDDSTPRR